MRQKRASATLSTAWLTALCSLCALLALFSSAMWWETTISVTNGSYMMNGSSHTFTLPLRIPNAVLDDIPVSFEMHLEMLHPTQFSILGDDCIQEMRVNGNIVQQGIPFCDFGNARTFDLQKELHTGTNTIWIRLHNNGGDAQLQFSPAESDLWTWVPPLLTAFTIFCCTMLTLYWLRSKPWIVGLCVVLLFGIALRMLYLKSTPYWVRGHDTDGHIEYMQYIADNGKLPVPDKGWETWQPPLYYAGGAAWLKTAQLMGFPRDRALFGLQCAALVLSIGSLLLIARTGMRILRDEALWALPYALLIPAVLPSFIFQAARINNDVLAIFLALWAFDRIVAWWMRPTWQQWLGISVWVGLTLLTKNTGLILLPVCFVVLLLRYPLRQWRIKLALGAMFLGVLLLVSGWFTVYRMIERSDQNLVIGNSNVLNSGLRVPNNVDAFTTFNPIAVLQHPYNSAWGDEERRQFFWEYLYRAAYFGEFNMGEAKRLIATWALLSGYFVLLLAACGAVVSVLRRIMGDLPVGVLAISVLLSHLAFRLQFPFSSSQDFRYSILLIVPVCLGCGRLLASLRTPGLRSVAIGLLEAFALLCTMTIL